MSKEVKDITQNLSIKKTFGELGYPDDNEIGKSFTYDYETISRRKNFIVKQNNEYTIRKIVKVLLTKCQLEYLVEVCSLETRGGQTM